jgi:hypothetical protein
MQAPGGGLQAQYVEQQRLALQQPKHQQHQHQQHSAPPPGLYQQPAPTAMQQHQMHLTAAAPAPVAVPNTEATGYVHFGHSQSNNYARPNGTVLMFGSVFALEDANGIHDVAGIEVWPCV